mmetsp:Transcript_18144/g.31007  ORF Transcript_18144/g.31007 Transcript_18144/m.31007 type:complete len:106 (+) Transcript_18144:1867-2184(+)
MKDLESQLCQLRSIFEPVKQRYFYYSEVDIYFGQFDSFSQSINSKLKGAKVSKHEMDAMMKLYEEVQQFMIEVRVDRDSKQEFMDPKFSIDLIVGRIDDLKRIDN